MTKELVETPFSKLEIDEHLVVGVDPGLSRFIGRVRSEMRTFPALSEVGVEVSSTESNFWLWVNCDERVSTIASAISLTDKQTDVFVFAATVDGFKNGQTDSGLGRVLSGYEDATENPQGDDATKTPLASDQSHFAAVQSWKQDMPWFNRQTQVEQHHMI